MPQTNKKDSGLCHKILDIMERGIMKYEVFMQFLVKCNDNKMVKLPYNLIIYPLTKPQVTDQQKTCFAAWH